MVCRLVLENSDVAEPHNIRDRFDDAIAEGLPITARLSAPQRSDLSWTLWLGRQLIQR